MTNDRRELPKNPTTSQTGALGEKIALDYILTKKYEIITTNFKVAGGEIDIIAKDKDRNILVFIEVKTRTNSKYGYGEESVSNLKKGRIRKAIEQFFWRNSINPDSDYRFDIIEVQIREHAGEQDEITHFEDAEL